MVKDVESVKAKFDCDLFMDGDLLACGHVGTEETWSTIGVETHVAEVVQAGIDEEAVAQRVLRIESAGANSGGAGDEGCEMGGQPPCGAWIARTIGDVGTAFGVGEGERQPPRPGRGASQLPTADERIGEGVDSGSKLPAFAEGQVIAAIRGDLLGANVGVALVGERVAPGVITGSLIKSTGPLVVGRDGQAVADLLGKRDLHGVEFSVLIGASIGNAVFPSAHAGGHVWFDGGCVVGVRAGWQLGCIVALQEVGHVRSAGCRYTRSHG